MMHYGFWALESSIGFREPVLCKALKSSDHSDGTPTACDEVSWNILAFIIFLKHGWKATLKFD